MKTIRFKRPGKRLYLLRAFFVRLSAFACGWWFLSFPFILCRGTLLLFEAGQALCFFLLLFVAPQGLPTVASLPLLLADGLFSGSVSYGVFHALRISSRPFRALSALLWLLAEALHTVVLTSVPSTVVYSDRDAPSRSAFGRAVFLFCLQFFLRVCVFRI